MTDTITRGSILGLVVLLVAAGCTMTGTYNEVAVTVDSVEKRDGTFHIQGEVTTTPAPESRMDFRDVRVVLYSADKRVLNATTVGNLSLLSGDQYPDAQSYTLTSPTRPKYILIESPDFWTTDEELTVKQLVWRDGEYQPYEQTNPGEKFSDD